MMQYKPLEVKSALNKIKKPRLPYNYDLNPYRGCEHCCKYCFAIYSHRYLEDGDYFHSVYYKKNIVEELEKKFSSPKWKREVIDIGGIADCYQPLEAQMKLMPEILKLMIRYRNPIIISTKSTLILRDIELIKELSEVAVVNIAFTITTLDENLRSKLEPNASPSLERFRALRKLKKETNAVLGVHMMPIIPYFTDNYKNLEWMHALASKVPVDYILPGTLYLRGETRSCFLDFAKEYDRDKYDKLYPLYQKNGNLKDYKKGLYEVLKQLREKYHLSMNYMSKIRKREASLRCIYKVLETYHIPYKEIEHKPVYTVEEAQKIKGDIEGVGCKNLFLKDKQGHFYLYLLEDSKTADFKQLEKILHTSKLTFATEEELSEHLGLLKGSVTPLGIIYDNEKKVTILLDSELEGKSLLMHPLTNTKTISMEYSDLLMFITNEDHKYQVIAKKE